MMALKLNTSPIARLGVRGLMNAAGLEEWNPGLPKDPACVALYRLEPGSNFLKDTKANANDLTQGAAAIVSQTALVRERKGAAEGNGTTQYAYRIDANLSADFPGKSGTGNVLLSVTGWMRCTNFGSAGTYRGLCGKGTYTGGQRSWLLGTLNNAGTFRAVGSYSTLGTNSVLATCDTVTLVANQWYHVGYVVKGGGVDRFWKIRVYDLVADAVYEKTATPADASMFCGTGPLHVGRADGSGTEAYFPGQWDEIAVFNGNLTSQAIDDIRKGKYKF